MLYKHEGGGGGEGECGDNGGGGGACWEQEKGLSGPLNVFHC